jgi:hypothetical protein
MFISYENFKLVTNQSSNEVGLDEQDPMILATDMTRRSLLHGTGLHRDICLYDHGKFV